MYSVSKRIIILLHVVTYFPDGDTDAVARYMSFCSNYLYCLKTLQLDSHDVAIEFVNVI